MKRTEIINMVAAAIGAGTYLEIGTRNTAENFDAIQVAEKMGADPKGDGEKVLAMTSDEFFAQNQMAFDLIFIDGDHRADQVRRDVKNAFKALAPGGVVIMHDCLPESAAEGAPEKPDNGYAWCGEAWRAFRYYRGLKSYAAACVNADHGVGIIRKKRKGEASHVVKWETAPWELSADRRRAAFGLVEPGQLEDFLAGWL